MVKYAQPKPRVMFAMCHMPSGRIHEDWVRGTKADVLDALLPNALDLWPNMKKAHWRVVKVRLIPVLESVRPFRRAK